MPSVNFCMEWLVLNLHPLRRDLDGLIRAPFEVHNILQPSMLCASDAFTSVHALRPGECTGLASVASADETFARPA